MCIRDSVREHGTKPLLKDPQFQQETKEMFGYALHNFLHFLHPFIPHITEAVWHSFDANASPVALQSWPALSTITTDHSAVIWFKKVITAVRSFCKKLHHPDNTFALYSTDSDIAGLFQQFLPIFNSMLPCSLTWSNNKDHDRTLCIAVDSNTLLFVYAPAMDLSLIHI